jgi:hypothetical protein
MSESFTLSECLGIAHGPLNNRGDSHRMKERDRCDVQPGGGRVCFNATRERRIGLRRDNHISEGAVNSGRLGRHGAPGQLDRVADQCWELGTRRCVAERTGY